MSLIVAIGQILYQNIGKQHWKTRLHNDLSESQDICCCDGSNCENNHSIPESTMSKRQGKKIPPPFHLQAMW
jgi:hypothetical protein